jgi:polyhydroxybutyrate depolymerase
MDVVADRAGFLVIYPNGTGRLSGRLLTWNAGTCCGYAASENVDDVAFVRALVEKAVTMTAVDRRRIYATGLSNGGMMAYRLAAEASDLVAAIAPVAGGMVLTKISNQRAVPVMHIHSVDDPRALYGGGVGPPFPLTNSRVLHPNVEQMVARWASHNGCVADGRLAARRTDPNPRGHTAELVAFEKCRDEADVVLWKLTGAGHVWPGGKQKYLERLLGPSTDIIDANAEMWSFFERFSLVAHR